MMTPITHGTNLKNNRGCSGGLSIPVEDSGLGYDMFESFGTMDWREERRIGKGWDGLRWIANLGEEKLMEDTLNKGTLV